MSASTASRLRLLPLRTSPLRRHTTAPRLSRPFITLPGSDLTQTLTATRILPYSRDPLYSLIADVDDYSSFVPYCSRSRVTHWSPADPASGGRRWPTRADLHVGWGGFDEKFTSRLTCVPGVSVEALSGGGGRGEPDASSVFRSLVTRWQLRPLGAGTGSGSPRTEVHLSIKYQFVNPLYAAVSAAVSDKVAGMMIEAFEKQARQKLGSQAPL
jgi:coenzyme Q-binding protein COQ10